MGNTCDSDKHMYRSEFQPKSIVQMKEGISSEQSMNNTELALPSDIMMDTFMLFEPKTDQEFFNMMSYDIMPYEAPLPTNLPKTTIRLRGQFSTESEADEASVKLVEKTYIGMRLEEKWNGRGVLITVDGYVFDGEFDNGKICDFGTLKRSDGSMVTGFWVDGRLEGEGCEKWADGSTYEGEYRNGYKEGKGTFTWSFNNIYKGSWKQDKPEGFVA